MQAPSALPGISHRWGDRLSAATSLAKYPLQLGETLMWCEGLAAYHLPTCGEDARQGRGGLHGATVLKAMLAQPHHPSFPQRYRDLSRKPRIVFDECNIGLEALAIRQVEDGR